MDYSSKITELEKEVNDLRNLLFFLLKKQSAPFGIRSELEDNEKTSFDRLLVKKWKQSRP
jgi:hypothetical protein